MRLSGWRCKPLPTGQLISWPVAIYTIRPKLKCKTPEPASKVSEALFLFPDPPKSQESSDYACAVTWDKQATFFFLACRDVQLRSNSYEKHHRWICLDVSNHASRREIPRCCSSCRKPREGLTTVVGIRICHSALPGWENIHKKNTRPATCSWGQCMCSANARNKSRNCGSVAQQGIPCFVQTVKCCWHCTGNSGPVAGTNGMGKYGPGSSSLYFN